ncbi:hypothetical protein [Rosistilla oblonga]|uniref:hypothetical protein n=1 Tax=Rosistilla oblonga TaxID=2527990 RepID=UPI003A97C046
MQLVIQPCGTVQCLYGEELELPQLGLLTIARGSHVEPTETGQWTADLSPVQGPVLGPFPSRSDALTAERQWLEAHWLTPAR